MEAISPVYSDNMPTMAEHIDETIALDLGGVIEDLEQEVIIDMIATK